MMHVTSTPYSMTTGQKAGPHDAMRLVMTGTQPELEALFVNRYERKLRMEAARTARIAKAREC